MVLFSRERKKILRSKEIANILFLLIMVKIFSLKKATSIVYFLFS